MRRTGLKHQRLSRKPQGVHKASVPRGHWPNRQNARDLTSVLDEVLCSEARYADRPIHWPGALSSKVAKARKIAVIKRLRRYGKKFKAAAELAEVLDGCRRGHRCRSASCPECFRAWQGWIVNQTIKVACQDTYPHLKVLAVSIAIAGCQRPSGQLDSLNVPKLSRRARRVLAASKAVEWAILGLDLSLNDERQLGRGRHWQPQLFGFVATSNPKALRSAMKSAFRPRPGVTKPSWMKEYDGSPLTASYAFKADAVLRISYFDSDHPTFFAALAVDLVKPSVGLDKRQYVFEITPNP